MKYFIKALKHYADFNGRASRNEYWMFMFFNAVFAFIWILFANAIMAKGMLFIGLANYPSFGSYHSYTAEETATIISVFTYQLMMFFPMIGATARRLHDAEISSWVLFLLLFTGPVLMLIVTIGWGEDSLLPDELVWFIMFGGCFPLLLMTLAKGKYEDNKYGSNPKTTPKILDEQTKIKSFSIVLIITSVVSVFSTVFIAIQGMQRLVMTDQNPYEALHWNAPDFIAFVILTLVGFFLLNKKRLCEIRENKKTVFVMLLVALFILFLQAAFFSVFEIISMFMDKIIAGFVLDTAIKATFSLFIYLIAIFLVASFLFKFQRKNIIRHTAILGMIFSALLLLYSSYSLLDSANDYLLNAVAFAPKDILPTVNCILLMGLFLPQMNSKIKEKV